jgi:hypothetical protein
LPQQSVQKLLEKTVVVEPRGWQQVQKLLGKIVVEL